MLSKPVPLADYTSAPVVSVPATSHLTAALRAMEERRISCVAVDDEEGRLVGALSRTDLMSTGTFDWHRSRGRPLLQLPPRPVGDLMRSPVVTVSRDDSLQEAARRMLDHGIHRVFVVSDGRAVGVVSTLDMMNAVADAHLETCVSELMTWPIVTVAARDPVSKAAKRLRDAELSSLLVVGDDGWPVGCFSKADALAAKSADRRTCVEDLMSARLDTVTPTTALHHAATRAAATRARQVVVVEGSGIAGVLSGVDFARAVLGFPRSSESA